MEKLQKNLRGNQYLIVIGNVNIFVCSLEKAFKAYDTARGINLDVLQTKLILSVSLDKKETNEAYLQASEFQVHIEDKKDELKEQAAAVVEKFPTHKEYLESLLNINTANDVETEINVLMVAINILNKQKELVTHNVVENKAVLQLLTDIREDKAN